jgi:hypothetical protein
MLFLQDAPTFWPLFLLTPHRLSSLTFSPSSRANIFTLEINPATIPASEIPASHSQVILENPFGPID